MKKYDNKVCVGIDYIKWHSYASKQDISIDLEQNIHTLISGMSGSGKSTSLLYYIVKLYFAFCSESLFIFADFKQDDQFSLYDHVRTILHTKIALMHWTLFMKRCT